MTQAPDVWEERTTVEDPLTPDEGSAFAGELARLATEEENADAELAAVKASTKFRLENIRKKSADILDQVRRDVIRREVTVRITMDYEAGKRYVTRLDSGEVISERDLLPTELQGHLIDPPEDGDDE